MGSNGERKPLTYGLTLGGFPLENESGQALKLSVIIPVFNEASTIQEVLQKVRQVHVDKEIIVINDGSTDATGEILEKERKDPVTVIYNSLINIGKGAGVRIGLEHARGEIVIVQDADLELDPEEYPLLIEPILRGKTKVVYGSRFLKAPFLQLLFRWGAGYLANWFLTSFTNLLYGSHLTDMETAYKVFHRDVIREIRLESLGFEIEPELTAKVLKLGHTILEIPIAYHPRTNEQGKKIRWVDGLHALFTLLKYRFQKEERFLRQNLPSEILEK